MEEVNGNDGLDWEVGGNELVEGIVNSDIIQDENKRRRVSSHDGTPSQKRRNKRRCKCHKCLFSDRVSSVSQTTHLLNKECQIRDVGRGLDDRKES